MANENRDPRAYELMSVLIPDMPEEDTTAAIERLNGYITSANGEVKESLTDSPWGRRRLAYTMRFNNVDYRDGYYLLTHFSATPHVISEIERDLKLDTQVIRYLLVMDDPRVGEKDTGQNDEVAQDEASNVEPAASTEAAPSEQGEAQETDSTEVASTDTTGEAEEAPAVEQAEEPTTSENIEAETADVAESIEGEENPAPADAPARKRATSSRLPEEGEGTDWVAGDGTSNVPEGFALKGNASSKIYHPEESGSYNNTIAEIYFATPEAAERFGYRLPKILQNAADAAAGSNAEPAKATADAASEEE